jgi:hypothetical protein
MLIRKWRISFIPHIFEEQPTELTVLLLDVSKVLDRRYRQLWKNLFIDRAFDHYPVVPASFGNDPKIPWSNADEPVDSPFCPLLQNLDPLGLDTTWAKLNPGLDGWVCK